MVDQDIVVRVEHLSKKYCIGHQTARSAGQRSLRESIVRQARNLGRNALAMARGRQIVQGDEVEDFWALKDVSFEVRRGEVIGIIGLNGAGKTTLLKVLSRITEPTGGRVTLRGRVASLLEVGTGFHPELSGRENIYLNGAILGMSKAEIDRRFDEIVDFAEVATFLDTPVKRYSSGMYVRLAFAVAAHLEPEILVIDEVLAVGDVVFQKKCLGKMQSVADSGRTVLFVSHNMQTVAGLTERVMLLQAGQVAAIGPPADVIERYLVAQSFGQTVFERPASGAQPEITRVALRLSGPGGVQQFGKPMEIDVDIAAAEPVPNAAVSFQVMTAGHQPVLHVLNLDGEVPMLRQAGTTRLVCRLPKVRLYPGHYYLKFHFGASDPRRVFGAPHDICPFEVAVLDQTRDFYWYPNNALYVEDVEWRAETASLV